MRHSLIMAFSIWLLSLALTAVEAVGQVTVTAEAGDNKQFQYQAFKPADYDSSRTYPVVLFPGVGAEGGGSSQRRLSALSGEGWVVIVFKRDQNASLSGLIGHLRRTYRIETQRVFLPVPAGQGLSEPRSWSRERPSDFHQVEYRPGDDLRARLAELRRRSRPASEPHRSVGAVLDDFHDCASKADGPRYFGHLAPKGVFVGTDASERWTKAEFQAWGGRYFKRDSAWIYVPQRRHIEIDGGLAWFDESLHSDSYGACRGTGALREIDGVWKIVQYHLSVPVPNALLGDLVTMVRNAADGAQARAATTVFVVRHAEKVKVGDDPLLTEAGQARARRLAMHLGSAKLDACFATQFRRTQKTAEPVCRAHGIEVTVLDARVDVAARVLSRHRGERVLIAGHSNTVPKILSKLGVRQKIRMTEADYGDLFVVTIDPKGKASLLRLNY